MDNFITAASFILTESCNLNCTYCFEKTRDIKKVMSKEIAYSAVDYLIDQAKNTEEKVIDILFFGGEPTLQIDLMKNIIDYAINKSKENDLNIPKFKMITNGFKFDKEVENFLLYWHQSGSAINIQISVDGCPEVQNESRLTYSGEGSSIIVENNIKKYIEFFNNYNISLDHLIAHGVVNKFSLPLMYKSYEYYKSLGFKHCWFLTLPEENWSKEDENILLQQLTLIKQDIINLVKQTNDISYYKNISSLSSCPIKHPDYPCLAGKKFVSIDTDGTIYPCHRFKFYDKDSLIGNIFSGVKDEDRDIFLEYDYTHLIGDIKCSNCEATSCYRCIAAFKEISGNMLIGSPSYCNMARIEHKIREELQNELKEQGYLISMETNIINDKQMEIIQDFHKTLQSIEYNLQYFIKEQDIIKQKLATTDKKLDITLKILTSLLEEE